MVRLFLPPRTDFVLDVEKTPSKQVRLFLEQERHGMTFRIGSPTDGVAIPRMTGPKNTFRCCSIRGIADCSNRRSPAHILAGPLQHSVSRYGPSSCGARLNFTARVNKLGIEPARQFISATCRNDFLG